jgi:hypothetical protein
MSNLFTSKPKIKLGQKSISYVSQNGQEYTENQKIIIDLDEQLEYFDPEQSYLKLDLELKTNSPTYQYLMQLDPLIGGSILLEDFKTFNQAGVLLEDYPNYQTWCNIKTLYSETETRINKDGLTEGVVAYNPDQKSWTGNTQNRFSNTQYNPYFKKDATGNVTYCKVRLCIKLKSGIMSSKTIFPNRMYGVLRFEFQLAPAAKCFKLFKNAIEGDYAPKLSHVGAGAKYTGYPASSSPVTEIYLSWANNMMVDANRAPFCVGDRISIEDLAGKAIISSIEMAAVGGENFIKLTTAQSLANDDDDIPSTAFVMSFGYEDSAQVPSYLVSNVEMVMEKVIVSDAYKSMMTKALTENGKMVYSCISAQNYRHSVQASDTNATVHLNINNSMAKSILCVPVTDQTATMNTNIEQLTGFRNGISGNWNYLESFQWTYDQKNQPDTPVECARTSKTDVYDGQYLTELEKALIMGGVANNSFEHIKTNCVIGRALALEGQIYDCRNKDFQLNLTYNSASDKAKLFNSWVVHVRRFVLTSSGVEVIY